MFKPTEEQQAIVDFALNESQNLIVYARAGAAKTSTLVLLSEALKEPGIALAFNKAIKEEMAERLSSNFKAMTMNGLGHKAWMQFISGRLTLNKSKVYDLVSARINEIQNEEDRREAFKAMSDIMNWVRNSKSRGWVPARFSGHWTPLLSDEDFWDGEEAIPTDFERDLVTDIVEQSFRDALKGNIDFDDQILCPAICSVRFERFPIVMVDEAQDLSPINHKIVGKLSRGSRLIAVGDPYQAIYGFRGADHSSMGKMQKQFNMHPLYLTITFRCGRLIVEEAKSRAGDIKAAPWAEEGKVSYVSEYDETIFPDNCAVICRNNAPIYAFAMRLLRNGKRPEVKGNDFLAGVLKDMKKFGKSNIKQDTVLEKIDSWFESMKRKRKDHSLLEDKAEVMKTFAVEAEDLGGALAYAEAIMQQAGPIKLMTGHKSKGLEFDDVFFLDPQLLRPEGQDPNLRYVIQTRAKKTLTYIKSEGWK